MTLKLYLQLSVLYMLKISIYIVNIIVPNPIYTQLIMYNTNSNKALAHGLTVISLINSSQI